MSLERGELIVVDETADTDEAVTTFLKDSGYEVLVIPTESGCLSRIRERKPDLILLCLTSDSIDSLSLLREVRKIDIDLPVIVLAREKNIDQVMPLLNEGANNYLMLPVAEMGLVDHVVRQTIGEQQKVEHHKRKEHILQEHNKDLVEQLRLLERDQQAGFNVQKSMMPETPFAVGNITFTHKIIPSLILSGDFIDYFELPDRRLLFFIADVSGHGASSAFVTVLLKSLFRRLKLELVDLNLHSTNDILLWINDELLQSELEQHVTMFLGMVDKYKKQLEYSNAAQFPGAILSTPESTRFLEIGGLPLGLYHSAEYGSRQVELPESFTMVMFSDGVFEIMPQETLKAKEEYLLSLVQCGNRSIESLEDHLGLDAVQEVPDDIAVFTVAKTG